MTQNPILSPILTLTNLRLADLVIADLRYIKSSRAMSTQCRSTKQYTLIEKQHAVGARTHVQSQDHNQCESISISDTAPDFLTIFRRATTDESAQP